MPGGNLGNNKKFPAVPSALGTQSLSTKVYKPSSLQTEEDASGKYLPGLTLVLLSIFPFPDLLAQLGEVLHNSLTLSQGHRPTEA